MAVAAVLLARRLPVGFTGEFEVDGLRAPNEGRRSRSFVRTLGCRGDPVVGCTPVSAAVPVSPALVPGRDLDVVVVVVGGDVVLFAPTLLLLMLLLLLLLPFPIPPPKKDEERKGALDCVGVAPGFCMSHKRGTPPARNPKKKKKN
jgi:hypothetical protein